MATGSAIDTGYEGLDALSTRGGMASMLGTVWLIISAMAFGGVLEYTGLLARLLQPVINAAKGDRSLAAASGAPNQRHLWKPDPYNLQIGHLALASLPLAVPSLIRR